MIVRASMAPQGQIDGLTIDGPTIPHFHNLRARLQAVGTLTEFKIMLLSASGTYLLVAIGAAVASYVLADRKGLNAVGWAWASLFLIVPAVILLFVNTRRVSGPPAGIPDDKWRALLAYDPGIKVAAARLAPFGAAALDDLRRAWEAVPHQDALPDMVSDIEARWSTHASAGLTHVETRDGVAVLRDAAGRFHVDGRQTADLATAHLMASTVARRALTPADVGRVQFVGEAPTATGRERGAGARRSARPAAGCPLGQRASPAAYRSTDYESRAASP